MPEGIKFYTPDLSLYNQSKPTTFTETVNKLFSMDVTRISKTISKYEGDIQLYKTKISTTQEEIKKDQAWIHKLEADIQEYKEAMEEKVQIIKDYQAKIFGAQEAIVALNDIAD